PRWSASSKMLMTTSCFASKAARFSRDGPPVAVPGTPTEALPCLTCALTGPVANGLRRLSFGGCDKSLDRFLRGRQPGPSLFSVDVDCFDFSARVTGNCLHPVG